MRMKKSNKISWGLSIGLLSLNMLTHFILPAKVMALDQAVDTANTKTQNAMRAIPRKIDVNVTSLGSGINSGLVIAYGHALKPPYKIEDKEGRYFVNNAQVEPSLIGQMDLDERLKKEPILAPEQQEARRQNYDQINQLTKDMRKLYFKKKDKEPNEQLHAEILAEVKTNPLIKDARWFSDTLLVYKEKNSPYDVEIGMRFDEDTWSKGKPSKSPEQIVEDKQQLLQARITEWENRLKRGGCIFFASVGGWQGEAGDCKDLAARVVKIMNQTNLSQEQKENQLSELFNGDHYAALDVLLNYKESEWK